jgi:lysozyme family protein
MSGFRRAIPKILKHEGGYVDHPNDPGGATNRGITLATFRRYIKPSGTKADLRRLTEDQAVIVYKRQYWDKVLADLLPAGVDYSVADFAVNSGPSRAARELQRILDVPVDGKIGPLTIAAARRKSAVDTINQLNDRRLQFMRGLRRGQLWKSFGRGWQARVDSVRRDSLAWAADASRSEASAEEASIRKAPPSRPTARSGGLWSRIRSAFRGK